MRPQREIGGRAYNFIANDGFRHFRDRAAKAADQADGHHSGDEARNGEGDDIRGAASSGWRTTEGVDPADYTDEAMMHYLRTERIIPPYQTRGYKLVELLRIYEAK